LGRGKKMTLNGAIMQLVEMHENSMMPVVFKPYLEKVIETISECVEPSDIPQWIPCSERYPDMDERVLVYTVAHEYHVWDCMSNRADNYFWEDEDGLYHNKYEASLWMPLPEPYKAESEHKE
jgi:hypothetical protein